MTDSRWQRVEELFHQARALPPDERAAFLDQACQGDAVIIRAVGRMLEALETADAVFEQPLPIDPLVEKLGKVKTPERPAMQVGNWRIDRPLAVGGMGDVFLAHRADDQFRMKAAVKLLRKGFDSEDLRRRFLTERQILAELKHPGIASLLDGGITTEGLPFLVMEFVEGAALDDYAQQRKLNVRARLELFRKVCEAVRYAHAHLVVHRDLKPSNILVTANGEVKLLDFGIAKLLDAPAGGEETSATAVLMTPRYASPEQALGMPVSTQSDVYSLGVVLFELLCGRSPYASTQRTVGEWFEAIQHEESPPVSTAVTAPELRKDITSDVDLIVSKALRKEPAERYASVEQLDADLRRYLEGQPIQARPQTTLYRLGKFVRRHRAGVAVTTLALAATLIAAGVALWEGHVAELERQRAVRRFEQVRELARLSLFDLFDVVKDIPGSTPAQQLLITKSLSHFERLSKEASGDAALLGELAEGYSRLADLYGNPYMSNLGESKKSLETYRKGLDLLKSVPEGTGPVRLEKSRALLLAHMGEVVALTGDAKGGTDMIKHGATLMEAQLTREPSSVEVMLELASLRSSLGDHLGGIGTGVVLDQAGTIDAFQKELAGWTSVTKMPNVPPAALTRARRGISVATMKLGNAARAFGKSEDALRWYKQAEDSMDLYDPVERGAVSSQRLRTVIIKGQADVLIDLNRPKEAVEALNSAAQILRDLVQRDPANRQFSYGLVMILRTRARAFVQLNDTPSALEDYRECERRSIALVEGDPANTVNRGRLDDIRNEMRELTAGAKK